MAYNNRGNAFYQKTDYEKAINDYDKAISINNTFEMAYLNRGISKEMLRDETGACKDWAKADELGLASGKQYYEQICK